MKRNALIVYGARKRFPYTNLGRAAYVAQTAYKNRGKVSKAARFAFKRYKDVKNYAKHSKPVGFEKDVGSSRQHLTHATDQTSIDTRTLYSEEMTDIPKWTTSANELYSRTRDMVNINGYKVCLFFKNDSDVPVYFHWAIVQPKTATTMSTADFFRNNGDVGTSGNRGEDFATTLSSLKMDCLSINTDKYNIVRHKRHIVGVRNYNQPYNNGGGPPSYLHISEWVKIGRQFRFEDTSTPKCTTPLYFVYWMDRTDNAGGATATIGAGTFSSETVCYWRNPIGC